MNIMMVILNILIIPLISFILVFLIQRKQIKINHIDLYILIAFLIYFIVTAGIECAIRFLGIRITDFSLRYTMCTLIVSVVFPIAIIFLRYMFGVSIIKNKDRKYIWFYVTAALLYCLSVIIIVVCLWLRKNFVFSFQEMIFTLLNPITGGTNQVTSAALKDCLPPILLYSSFIIYFIIIEYKNQFDLYIERFLFFKIGKIRVSKGLRIIAFVLSFVMVLYSLFFLAQNLGIKDYCYSAKEVTTIYEEHYIDPHDVEITHKKQTKNLLLIYVESLENTYQSIEDGGANPVNYIPNATKLAKENISFSNNDKIGGLRPVKGTTWTMASLFASLSGVQAFLNDTENEDRTFFLPGIVTMGDILSEFNYNQEFLCGSDATFAGRDKFFEQHGNYEIVDLYAARKKGYIAPNYNVWWGFEDDKLYKIAKDEINELYKKEQPFNFTMLTVDTHPIGGYRCELCGNEYESEMGNIVSCADKQLFNFIEWCKDQPFYNETLIVILGDHPRMDKYLVDGVEYIDRTNYNCFINAEFEGEVNMKNREATHFDMFPTILSAMGFEIKGDKLGLGVNLFSEHQTLPERIGLEKLDSELKKHSNYFSKFTIPR